MAAKKATPTVVPPTIITLTFPAESGDFGTLLIQRGELAHIRQFRLWDEESDDIDYSSVIREAYASLAAVEAAPPTIPEPPAPPPTAPRPASTYVPPKREPVEPMIEIPLAKGRQSIKASYLQLSGEQTDEAAMREAKLIAGKLIDGKLWDGKYALVIDDVYGIAKKMKYLAAKDLCLFGLEEFAKRAEVKPAASIAEPERTVVEEITALLEEEEVDELEEVNE